MLRADDLLAGRGLVFIDDFTLIIYDLQNGNRWDFFAASGDDSIGTGLLQQAYIAAAQREIDRIDEKLYLEVFAAPKDPRARPRTRA